MANRVSNEELKAFHSVDRHFYIRLVLQLRCNFLQALHIMALWLWLEEVGYPSIILTLRNMPDVFVDAVYDEGVIILNSLESETLPSLPFSYIIPRTYRLVEYEINLELLHEYRDDVLDGIIKTVGEVCRIAFDDCIQLFAELSLEEEIVNEIAAQTVDDHHYAAEENAMPMSVNPYVMGGVYPIIPNGGYFRPVPIIPNAPLHFQSVMGGYEIGESSNRQAFNQGKKEDDAPPEDDRAMFMTFSRGYQVSEEELRTYLLRSYGDVIEKIEMQGTPPGVQPLWARVLFRSAASVAKILNGRERVKFVVKGKHVLARRYVPKN